MATQGFVNQPNFENDMAVRSGSVSVASTDFTHGIQVAAPTGHAKSSSGVQMQQATAQIQQQTVQQPQHTQQVLHTIAPDSFPSNNIKNEGILIVTLENESKAHVVVFMFLYTKGLHKFISRLRFFGNDLDRKKCFPYGLCILFTSDIGAFFRSGFGNSDVHFVEGDQSAMYANGSG